MKGLACLYGRFNDETVRRKLLVLTDLLKLSGVEFENAKRSLRIAVEMDLDGGFIEQYVCENALDKREHR